MSQKASDINPERPEPLFIKSDLLYAQKKSDTDSVINHLISGEPVQVADAYPIGLSILAGLKRKVFGGKHRFGKNQQSGKKPKDDFSTYRNKRVYFRFASNNLLVPVENNKIALRKSPDIGWLERLYPDVADFYLSFPQIQGLNSSWQWYVKGINYPVLKQPLHPWYGTYFPTRFDHLKLFDSWLKNYQGGKSLALDIGTGCGVLAFQLIQGGFEEAIAADINPNAVISVWEDAEKQGVSNRLQVIQSDLIENCDRKADLIVFNPPWLPADDDITGMDRAIFYEPELFERFFETAGDNLRDDGKIVLFFSNLGRIEGMQSHHPIVEEIAKNRRYRKRDFMKRKVVGASRKTRRRDHRKNEYVELWELEKNYKLSAHTKIE